eukprot:Opistho-2@32116
MPSGTFIGDLTALGDPDAGATFTCKINAPKNGQFDIVANKLRSNASLDYETLWSYTLTIECNDQGGLGVTRDFDVFVVNVNEPPKGIALKDGSLQIEENKPVGTLIGRIQAIGDPEQTDGFSYQINVQPPGDITLIGLVLQTSRSFNFESVGSYNVTVTATDNGGLSVRETLIISVVDVNEPGTSLELSRTSIVENVPYGTVVGNLSVVGDPDIGEAYVFDITFDPEFAFYIDGSQLCVGTGIDYETLAQYSLELRGTDRGGLSITRRYVIMVIDVNETPDDVALRGVDGLVGIPEGMPARSLVASLNTEDPDMYEAFAYNITMTGPAVFSIKDTFVYSSTVFDFEATPFVVVQVTTTDTGSNSLTREFSIPIFDVNEPPTDIKINQTSVREMSPVGTTVGLLSSTDPEGGTFLYSLIANPFGSFAIVQNRLTVARVLDYESGSKSINITIQTSDQYGLTFRKNFTISIVDVNEAPSGCALSNNTISENVPAGAVIGTLSQFGDPDLSEAWTFAVVAPGNDSFAITGGNSLVTVRSFDFETTPLIVFSVQVTDRLGLTAVQQLTVFVTNVNEAPSAVTITPNAVPENTASGYTVGKLLTADPDAGDTFTYVLATNDAGAFTLSGDSVQAVSPFNFEVRSQYSISIRTTDKAGLSVVSVVNISVSDVNEAPTAISLSSSNITENMPRGTLVARLTSVDADANEVFKYQLLSDPTYAFYITGNGLYTNRTIDYEVDALLLISIVSVDRGNLSFTASFNITVNNIVEAPTGLVISSTSVAENLPSGTGVGVVKTVGGDNDMSKITLTLVTNENSAFTLVGTTLATTASFDFENKTRYSVSLTATDQLGQFVTAAFIIAVVDVNEPPRNVSLNNTQINENSAVDAVVGVLSPMGDPDGNETHTFALVSNPGNSFVITGNVLRAAIRLNYEVQKSVSIAVSCVDKGGLTVTRSFSIVVNDMNDASTTMALSSTTIFENAPNGTIVGFLTTADEDVGEVFTYSLITNPTDAFFINGTTLLSNRPFDFETASSYRIVLMSQDHGNSTLTREYVISVLDANEPPVDIKFVGAAIDENCPIGTLVGSLDTVDPDAGDVFTYSMFTNAPIEVKGNRILVSGTIDYEALKGQISMTVTTTDRSGFSMSLPFTVRVNDLPEAGSAIILSNNTISEDTIDEIGNLTVAGDPDMNDSYNFTIVSDPSGCLVIIGDKLMAFKGLDFEKTPSFVVQIKSVDKDGLAVKQALNIYVTDVPEPPLPAKIEPGTVLREAVANSFVGRVLGMDQDAGDSVSCKFDKEFSGGLLKVVDGKVYTTDLIANVSGHTVAMQFTCRDSLNLTSTLNTTITIQTFKQKTCNTNVCLNSGNCSQTVLNDVDNGNPACACSSNYYGAVCEFSVGQSKSGSSSSSGGIGTIVPIVVGCVVGACAVAGAVVYYKRRKGLPSQNKDSTSNRNSVIKEAPVDTIWENDLLRTSSVHERPASIYSASAKGDQTIDALMSLADSHTSTKAAGVKTLPTIVETGVQNLWVASANAKGQNPVYETSA